jgi:serine/threonine protein kinase
MVNIFTETKLDFKLIKKVGNGGEGEVYKTNDRQLNSIIAVKKVPIASFKKEATYFEEAKKLHLTKHQNIVPIKFGSKDEKFIYLAMPLYENGSLKSLMDKRFLSSREIIKYSLQFLSGLNHIHTKKLLHFDIKPENILLSNSNQAIISDFGLAEYTGRYGFSKIHGTTAVFAPPELFIQAEHNLKYDIYQAGITLYRMCVGDIIFHKQIKQAHILRGNSNQANFINALSAGKFPNRSFHLSHIPLPLRKIITKALNPNPDDRYSSILEMMNDLSSIEKADDWIFSSDYSTFECWIKPNYEVNCTFANGNWDVKATKKGRRKTAFCGTQLNNSEKNKLTYRCLTTNW